MFAGHRDNAGLVGFTTLLRLCDGIGEFLADMAGLVIVLTGGCGYVGSRMVAKMAREETCVRELRVVDVNTSGYRAPEPTNGMKITVMQGDVRDEARMLEVCTGADVIIHTAALLDFMGKFPDQVVWDINVKVMITRKYNIVCFVKQRVLRYGGDAWELSGRGRAFLHQREQRGGVRAEPAGDPVPDGDEETPYDSSTHSFFYATTKAEAEDRVLRHDGRRTAGGKTLRTCSLRPMGMYGEGLMNLFVDIERAIANKQSTYAIANDKTQRCTFVYLDNFLHALRLTLDRLVAAPDVVGGQVYFISDDTPVNNYVDHRKNFLTAIGFTPEEKPFLPIRVLYALGLVFEFIRWVLSPVYNFQPPWTSGLILVSNTTMCLRYDKATRHLGYRPVVPWEEAKRRTVDWIVAYWASRQGGMTEG
ncbi:HSD3B1 [Branchiostoma lanceolatum]|uniref:HSD3B1 protein n=1 Tax=Branchiostoma lanceolatum TaxID=7740 RepID=A0A8K0ESE1_BRALA|nr:HSD3B1 [Branchiostoma lanceolatum]